MSSRILKRHVQTRINLPSGLSDEQIDLIADRILRRIRERTKSGIDKNSKPFQGYSKNYTNSLDFKNAGKSGRVTLSSSGDMLAELDVVKKGRTYIIIGYEVGSDYAGQVQGNVTGEYGNSKPVTKGRDFLGLPQKEIDSIIDEVKADSRFQELSNTYNQSKSITDSIMQALFRGGSDES